MLGSAFIGRRSSVPHIVVAPCSTRYPHERILRAQQQPVRNVRMPRVAVNASNNRVSPEIPFQAATDSLAIDHESLVPPVAAPKPAANHLAARHVPGFASPPASRSARLRSRSEHGGAHAADPLHPVSHTLDKRVANLLK